MSSTYRQSSSFTKESLQKDPENVFLSRGPRNKLNAELLKDHVLASSGLINKMIGGASVKPYQPKGLWEAATSGRGQLAQYVQDTGDQLYRRGIYNFIKRTVPPPNMLIMDGSNRDQCEVSRSLTNTPLQALVLLNDPFVLEASAFLSKELLENKKLPVSSAIETAFQKIVCRKPQDKEKKHLLEFYDKTLKNMNVVKAKQLLTVGESIEIDEIKDHTKTASMMQTVQLLYNLEETLTR